MKRREVLYFQLYESGPNKTRMQHNRNACPPDCLARSLNHCKWEARAVDLRFVLLKDKRGFVTVTMIRSPIAPPMLFYYSQKWHIFRLHPCVCVIKHRYGTSDILTLTSAIRNVSVKETFIFHLLYTVSTLCWPYFYEFQLRHTRKTIYPHRSYYKCKEHHQGYYSEDVPIREGETAVFTLLTKNALLYLPLTKRRKPSSLKP